MQWFLGLALALAGAAPAWAAEEAVPAAARALHERLLTLDSHLDTPAQFDDPRWDILQRHEPDLAKGENQVDYPRMVEGGLDGGWWVIYTEQTGRTPADNRLARDHGLKRLLQIHELVAAHPDKFELALTAADAPRIAAAGRRVVYISMENASPLTLDPSLLQFYYDQGLRMMSLVHFKHNEFSDSSTQQPPEWKGLSPAGKALVAEANRLGIVLDQSHGSDEEFDQLLALSRAPFVLSHSSSDALYEHGRNIDDARLRKLAEKGGVIQVNSVYLKAADKTPATIEDFFAHLLHVLKVAGPGHVGFGADWDGGGGVAGMEDVTDLPKITARLLQEGYTGQQIGDMWSGNILRVMAEAERVAREIAAAQAVAPAKK
jgi:membrane dipeptidase